MPTVYETEFWRVRLPDGWTARETQLKEVVAVSKVGGGHGLAFVTREIEPRDWPCKDGELFHGQLYGLTRDTAFDFSTEWNKVPVFRQRWWCLWCGNRTVYAIHTCFGTACETHNELDEIIHGLAPKNW